MAENDQTQEKNQEPTQRRLEKAREDGDVLSSKEMFVFATSATGLLVLTVLGFFANGLLDMWGSLFTFSHPEELLKAKSFNSWQSFKLVISGAAVFAIPCFAGVILIQTVIGGGLSFSAKALGFKWNKLDPIKGLGRIFSVKGLVELVKSIAKVVFFDWYCYNFYLVCITKYNLPKCWSAQAEFRNPLSIIAYVYFYSCTFIIFNRIR